MATTAPTRPWTGPPRSRRAISTTARSRSTAAPTRSSATSSPRRCWGFNFLTLSPLFAGRGQGGGASLRAKTVERPVPPHPDRKGDPTSPRKRGEVKKKSVHRNDHDLSDDL